MGRCCCDLCLVTRRRLYDPRLWGNFHPPVVLTNFIADEGQLVSTGLSAQATFQMAPTNFFDGASGGSQHMPEYLRTILQRGERWDANDYGYELIFEVDGDTNAYGAVSFMNSSWITFGQDFIRPETNFPDRFSFSFPAEIRITCRKFPHPDNFNNPSNKGYTYGVYVDDVLTFTLKNGYTTVHPTGNVSVGFRSNWPVLNRTQTPGDEITISNLRCNLIDYERYSCDATGPLAQHNTLNTPTDVTSFVVSGFLDASFNGTYTVSPAGQYYQHGGTKSGKIITIRMEFVGTGVPATVMPGTSQAHHVLFFSTGEGLPRIIIPSEDQFDTPVVLSSDHRFIIYTSAGAAATQQANYDSKIGDDWTITVNDGAPPSL